MEPSVEELKTHIAVLHTIIQRYLNIDLGAACPRYRAPSVTVRLEAPQDTTGLWRIAAPEAAQPPPGPPSQAMPPKPVRKRALPTRRNMSGKTPTVPDYKSGSDDERRVARRLEQATSSNCVYAGHEEYCDKFASPVDMMQNKLERFKSIPRLGLSAYMRALQEAFPINQHPVKETFQNWEVRLMNNAESIKVFVTQDNIDMLRKGQALWWQETIGKQMKGSRTALLSALNSPLLQYQSLVSYFSDFFTEVSNYLGACRVGSGLAVCRLRSVARGIMQWEQEEKWVELVLEISQQLVNYMTQRFKQLYFHNFHTNAYCEELQSVPELRNLLVNLAVASDPHAMGMVLQKVLVQTRPLALDTPEIKVVATAPSQSVPGAGPDVFQHLSETLFQPASKEATHILMRFAQQQ